MLKTSEGENILIYALLFYYIYLDFNKHELI
jgi:hypothetical protein